MGKNPHGNQKCILRGIKDISMDDKFVYLDKCGHEYSIGIIDDFHLTLSQ